MYDEELDGKIDGTQIGDVVRAAGLKPTNAMVAKVKSIYVLFKEIINIYYRPRARSTRREERRDSLSRSFFPSMSS